MPPSRPQPLRLLAASLATATGLWLLSPLPLHWALALLFGLIAISCCAVVARRLAAGAAR